MSETIARLQHEVVAQQALVCRQHATIQSLLDLLTRMSDFFSREELPPNYSAYRMRHSELIGEARAMVELIEKGEAE